MPLELWMYGLSAAFVGWGSFTGFTVLQSKRFVANIRSWELVVGQVTRIDEVTHDYASYQPQLEYSFRGNSYKSSPKQLFPYREQIPTQISVHVNPKNPRDVYSTADLLSIESAKPLISLMSLSFIVVGIGFLLYMVFLP